MSSLVYRINGLLCQVVSGVGIGTNLDLFLLLWMILGGRLLLSRGGVIPGLALFGLSEKAVRRCWAALTYGCWETRDLIQRFEKQVVAEGRFQPHAYGGYRPVAGDLTGFFRPCLKGCKTKHYSAPHGKALPAIPVGLLARVGSVEGKRLSLPLALVRADPNDPGEPSLRGRLLQEAKRQLTEKEALVLDRGFPLSEIQAAGIERYVVRGPQNFTARRSQPPPYKGWGRRPTKGEIVRPLARKYRNHFIPATPPDRKEEWRVTGKGSVFFLRAEFWDDLVSKEEVAKEEVAKDTEGRAEITAPETFRCVVIYDPRYIEPLLLVTPLDLSGDDLRRLYLDRWPIEGLPQVAKQMLGAARQFVFGEESRKRLPELSLLSGAILSYLAATEPAPPAGFWDRSPKPTAGRLRRVLATVHFEDLEAIPNELRKKDSPTAHLPKGIQAHRRQKRSIDPSRGVPLAA